MCTFTFYPQKNGDSILTFNRDESPNRSNIEIVNDQKRGLIYPKDSLHGGTWLVSNPSRGRVACLLNGAFVRHERQLPYGKSRGIMLLESMDFERIEDFFSKYDFTQIEPFTMVVIEKNTLFSFRWTGSMAVLNRPDKSKPQIWSSATLYDEKTQQLRRKWFAEAQNEKKEALTPTDLWQFHQTGGVGDLENALHMKRDSGVETVSQAQILLSFTTSQIQFHYHEFKNNATIHHTLPMAIPQNR